MSAAAAATAVVPATPTALATSPPPSPPDPTSEAIERVLVQGDLSRLTTDERLLYVRQICQSLGLNPLTQPFVYMTLKNKLVLYATKDGVAQLRKNHNVSVEIVGQSISDELLTVHAKATMPGGGGKAKRSDEDYGVVSLAGLKGEDRANAILKAVTKAKRRVTLSLCGLGFLDESEVQADTPAPVSTHQVQLLPVQPVQPQAAPQPVPQLTHQSAEPFAQDFQLAELVRLKADCRIDSEGWKNQVLARRGVTTARALTMSQADELIQKLKHRLAAQVLESALPDGWGRQGLPPGSHRDPHDDLTVNIPTTTHQEAGAPNGSANFQSAHN